MTGLAARGSHIQRNLPCVSNVQALRSQFTGLSFDPLVLSR
jgi:hypothetical protein